MRHKVTRGKLTLQAIAGTHVVLLGFHLDEAECEGLLGFALHRTDHEANEAAWLRGLKTFEATDPGLPPGSTYSTRDHPVQGFAWSDFTAKPGRRYTYRVVALTGTPQHLVETEAASVEVRTESPEDGRHDVYFNRGAAASQEYARRFGNRSPKEVGSAAFTWLSRGLYEALTAFVDQAADPAYALHVCAYEFHHEGFLRTLKAAVDRGVDVHVVYDHRQDEPGTRNAAAVHAAGLDAVCRPREASPNAIAHNKFIVRSRGGQPEAVLTGSTNFSESGIFGHANVVHVVEDRGVANTYLEYWRLIEQDLENAWLRPQVTNLVTLPPGGSAQGTTAVFSPRKTTDALTWYADLARGAREAFFATFAFGMHEAFQEAYRRGAAPLRYALLEKVTRPMGPGEARQREEQAILDLRRMPENRFAVGSHLTRSHFDRWLAESLSGLNHNVRYVHTKFLLVDPLGEDPVVVTGSANFSRASCVDNDENMLVIRGDARVADVYLGEFMRLYNHFAWREWLNARGGAEETASPSHLRTDAWWREYFGGSARSRQRAYFAGVPL